ncbi:Fanconi-associated nuclease 1 [Thalassocella blandensis]|nr:Fanconi-associated nuclease 1 [Thalassocella blandensis]
MLEAVELAPDYYLRNFVFLLDWVESRYANLMQPDEKQFLQDFKCLSHDSQCLLVRLAGRKGVLFRQDKLEYPEIGSLANAVEQLYERHMVQLDPELSFAECVSVLTKPELVRVFGEQLKGKKSLKRAEIIALLAICYEDNRRWSSWTEDELGALISIRVQACIDLVILLFFGNSHQDLTEFVLQDLGLFTYENFHIDPEHQIFSSREELEEYQLLQQLTELAHECEQNKCDDPGEAEENVERTRHIISKIPLHSDSPRNQNKIERLRNRIAYRLEQAGSLDEALALYKLNSLTPSRERQIRILEKTGDFCAAWALLGEVEKSPYTEHEAQVVERIKPRLIKKLTAASQNLATTSLQLHNQMAAQKTRLLPERKLGLQRELNTFGVEEACRVFYEGAGGDNHGSATAELNTPCFFLENQLFNALFGLWLWPELFKSVDGAFANPFQMAPLDLYQQDFVVRRPGIQKLWRLLDDETYKSHILAVWQSKFGIANHFVHWEHIDESLLTLSLSLIPAVHLRLIFQRLLFDIKANKSGFPDLIQFDLQRERYQLIEVKGPNDRLQDNQIRWINFFLQHEIPVEVCYVTWE